jgi:cell division protein FtsB
VWHETIVRLATVLLGGGLATVISVLFRVKKGKHDMQERNIDKRIEGFEKIADRNERRMEQLEKKQMILEGEIMKLEQYAFALERIIIQLDPTVKLPPRPIRGPETAKG